MNNPNSPTPSPTHPFTDPLVILLFLVAALLTWVQIHWKIATPAATLETGLNARLFESRWVISVIVAGAIAGIAIGIRMFVKREPLPDPPRFQMSDNHATRVCLGWYIFFLSSASIASLINGAIPLGVFVLPTTYLLHAILGIAFICVAENITPLALWKKISKNNRFWLFRGIQFFLLALGAILILSAILSPFMPDENTSQIELINFIRNNSGIVPFMVIFSTVALIGPAFEEIFFRGYLLSVLRRRLPVWGALILSSALFGAIHFQAQSFPVLALLGLIMGLAFLRTGDIKVAIFVHVCWNGGVFLLHHF